MIKWKGIKLGLHPLFFLIIIGSIVTGQFLPLLTLFAIVFWHELGHYIAALYFGWKVKEIRLLPFGGVLEVDQQGFISAREEIIVALAGPAQNVILAGIAYFFTAFNWISEAWGGDFIRANAIIALFNLLPILPLDGGRIFQARLSQILPYYRTLLWTIRLSFLFSFLFLAASFYPLLLDKLLNLNLLVIGLFLFSSNWSFYRNIPYLFLRFLVYRSERAEMFFTEGKLSRPIVIHENCSLFHILKLYIKEQYHPVYLMARGKIVKIVPEKTVIDGFLRQLPSDLSALSQLPFFK